MCAKGSKCKAKAVEMSSKGIESALVYFPVCSLEIMHVAMPDRVRLLRRRHMPPNYPVVTNYHESDANCTPATAKWSLTDS